MSDAGALFGPKACQFSAVSQWFRFDRGWTTPFLRQLSNTGLEHGLGKSNWMCAAARARAAAHQTRQPHAGVGYAAMAAYEPEVSPRRWKNTQPGQQMQQEGRPDIAEIRSPGKQIHQTCRRPINFHSLSERLRSLA